MQFAGQLNRRADRVLSNVTSLNSSAAQLVEDIDTATTEVDQLEQAVMDDREAISELTNTANETIVLSKEVLDRITVVNVSMKACRKVGRGEGTCMEMLHGGA